VFDAGRLRERITILRKQGTKNAGGGLDVSWPAVAENVSAEIVGLNGRESLIGGVLQGISYFQITIRYRADLKPSDQILWLTNANRELNIIDAEDKLGTRQWTVIQASTAAPQGA
jgi:head-tail adaptor